MSTIGSVVMLQQDIDLPHDTTGDLRFPQPAGGLIDSGYSLRVKMPKGARAEVTAIMSAQPDHPEQQTIYCVDFNQDADSVYRTGGMYWWIPVDAFYLAFTEHDGWVAVAAPSWGDSERVMLSATHTATLISRTSVSFPRTEWDRRDDAARHRTLRDFIDKWEASRLLTEAANL